MSSIPIVSRRLWSRRVKSMTAATVAAVLVTTLAQAVPAAAQPDEKPPAPQRDQIPPVAVQPVTATKDLGGPAIRVAGDKPEPVWPAGGETVAPVPAAPVRQASGRLEPDGGLVEPARTVHAGGLPVRVDRAAAGDAPDRVRVQVLDRAATAGAGVRGVLLRLTAQDADGAGTVAAGAVRLWVDYAGFATGFGADWASRLRLVTLPGCALAGPADGGCAGRPLRTDNQLTAQIGRAHV